MQLRKGTKLSFNRRYEAMQLNMVANCMPNTRTSTYNTSFPAGELKPLPRLWVPKA